MVKRKGQFTFDFPLPTYYGYVCQRYYDPQIGRFITLDSFGGYIELPQTQNRYAYCINNPLKYIDPLGLDAHPKIYPPEDENNASNEQKPTSQFPSKAWGEVWAAGEILIGSGAMLYVGYSIIGASISAVPVSGGWSLLGIYPGLVFMTGGFAGLYFGFTILKPYIESQPQPQPKPLPKNPGNKNSKTNYAPLRPYNKLPREMLREGWYDQPWDSYPLYPLYRRGTCLPDKTKTRENEQEPLPTDPPGPPV